MFGWSVHVFAEPTRLVVTDPVSWTAVFWAALFTLGPIAYLAAQRPLPARRLTALGVVLLVVFAFVLDSTSLVLDKNAATFEIRRFALYHWSTQSAPLGTLDHAYLTTGATTARITLQMRDGQTYSLSSNNQMGGKPQAVLAINRFLGVAD